MKSYYRVLAVAGLLLSSASAFAEGSTPTLPDGPVPSPPGWSCEAKGGVVTSEKLPETGPLE
jgi:hypothetical protein